MASHGISRPATFEARSEVARQKELKDIESYKELVDLVNAKVKQQEYTLEVLQLTSKLIKRNPEYYTLWNVRRRLLTHGLFSKSSASSSLSKASSKSSTHIPSQINTASSDPSFSSTITTSTDSTTIQPSQDAMDSTSISEDSNLTLIQDDLNFLVPLLMKYPKCYWIWNYRLWLLQEAIKRVSQKASRSLWEAELGLAAKMLSRDNRNFHGWGYRRTIVAQLESPELYGKSMVEEEFAYTTKMINVNLSNFSAWHNRSKLIPRLLDERSASHEERKKFLDEEFYLMTEALFTDPYDQSLWFYYQFLMTTLTDPAGYETIVPELSNEERIKIVKSQLSNLNGVSEEADDCKWVYDALLEYTLGYSRLESRAPSSDEKKNCDLWLAKMRKLDPKRSGRWDDIAASWSEQI